jgi:hypothetical protein
MEMGRYAGFARRAWGACAARTALVRTALLVLAFFSGVLGGAQGGFAAMAQWTPLTSVNTLVANVSTEDAKSEVLPDGRTWMAYWTNVGGVQNYQFRAQLLDTAGVPLLGPNGVSVVGGNMGTYLVTWDLTVDASGNLLVGFTRTDGSEAAVVQKISPAGLPLFGANGKVLGTGYDVKLLALPNGQTIVGYLPGDYGTMMKLSTTGTNVWANPVVVYPASGSKTSIGELVALTGGTFLVVFHDRGNFGISSNPYARRYNHGTGLPMWNGPVALTSGYATSFNRRYDLIALGDTAYFGFSGAGAFDFQGFIQRINPDGSLPWGSTGVNFMDQSVLYEMSLSLALEDDSPYLWALCTMTTSAQQNTGETVQKINKKTGARPLGVSGVQVFGIGAADRRHEGALRVINHQPTFVFSDGNSNGVFPKDLKLMTLNSVGLPATAVPLPLGTHPTGVKSRVEFSGQFAGKGIATWVENRNGAMRPYAQRRGLTCPAPWATATGSATGLMAQFTGSVLNADSARWYFGDGTWAMDTNGTAAHAYNGAGTYTACLVAYSACGVDSACVTLNVCPLFGGPWLVAQSAVSLAFTAPVGADSLWVDFGDGTLVGAVPPSAFHTYTANGTYTATAVAFSSCRTDTVVQGLVVNSIGLEEGLGGTNPAGWLYPNPVVAGASVRWHVVADGLGTSKEEGLLVRWLNALGQEVARGSWEADALAVPHLPAGRYWVEWIGPNGIPVRLSIGVH